MEDEKVTISKKRTKKIIIVSAIIIVAIIAVIAIVIAVQNIFKDDIKIKETEEKLVQINTEELEQKLIEELKKTNLNISTKHNKLSVNTTFAQEAEFKGYISAKITFMNENTIMGIVKIPCFKIEKDENGKFKNIEYVETFMNDENMIANTVKNVLSNEYNINLKVEDNEKYNTRFNKVDNTKKEIYITNDDVFSSVVSMIKGSTSYFDKNLVEFKEYTRTTFGVDFMNQDNTIEGTTDNKIENNVQTNSNSLQPSNNTNNDTIIEGYTTFTEMAGIELKYPANYKSIGTSDQPTFMDPDVAGASFNIVSERFPSSLTFEGYVEASIQGIKSQMTVKGDVNTEYINLNDRKAAKLDYIVVSGSQSLVITQIVIQKDKNAYILTLASLESDKEAVSEKFDNIIKSFK